VLHATTPPHLPLTTGAVVLVSLSPRCRYCSSEQVDCPLPPLPASLPMTLPSMTGLMMKMTMMMMTMMMMTMMMMMMMMMLMMMTMMTMMMMTMMLMY
jgi:hypothetical protein